MKSRILFAIAAVAAFHIGVTAANYTRHDDVIVKGTMSVGSNTTPNSKAVFDAVSTTKGLLIPRMDSTQRDAITSPTTGLQIYNTTTNRFSVYDGTAWREMVSFNGGGTLTGITIDADDNTISDIDNGEIKAAAGIALNKLAAMTASRIAISDGSGFLIAADTATYPNLTELAFGKGVTSTLCGINQSCTETNKTFTAPAINGANLSFGSATNTNRIVLPTETTVNLDALTDVAGLVAYDTTLNKVVYNNGSVWTAVGSGSGGGTNDVREFISNGTFETDIVGWTAYADAAASSPVDCTGGSPNITINHTTTGGEVLRGTGSLEMVKDASNRQGEGWATDFTIDPANYKAGRPVYISWDYGASSTNYASGDVKAFIYDKDAAAMLAVQDVSALAGALPYADSASGGARWSGVFYPTTSTSDDYRLCLHIATTNATAYDFHIDSVHGGITPKVPSPIVTEWASFTPTGAWSANTTYTGKWRRVGDTMELDVRVATSGAPTTASLTITVPFGFSIDTSKLTTTADGLYLLKSDGLVVDSGSRVNLVKALTTSNATSFYLAYDNGSGTVVGITQAAPITFGNTDFVQALVSIPIVNWTAGASLSTSEILLSTVKVRAYNTAGTSIPNTGTQTVVPFATETYDTHNAWVTDTFTAPKTGVYQIKSTLLFAAATWSAANRAVPTVYINGNLTSYGDSFLGQISTITAPAGASINVNLPLVKGDTVQIKVGQTRTGGASTLDTTANTNFVEISELPEFSIFSVYGMFEILTATSATKTPGATNHYHNLSGNSLALTAGTWKLKATATFYNGGSTPSYGNIGLGFFAANGADSSSQPNALSTVSGLTVLTSVPTLIFAVAADTTAIHSSDIIVRCASSCTVYAVTYATATTPANARITAYGTAERLQ